ncbi:ATP-binding protein, partial [Actinotignum sp. GS-2025a]
DLGKTICAFANMPEGGFIILGVSEPNFDVIGVTRPADIEAGVVSVAQNAIIPAPSVTTRTLTVNGTFVVAAQVHPLAVMHKPATFQGSPYLRQADGDYVMPANEQRMLEVAKLTDRDIDSPDSQVVADTSVSDLQTDLAEKYIRACRREVRSLSENSDEEVLRNTRVVRENQLTLAGLYGLGTFPQGPCPALAVTVAVRYSGTRATVRTSDLKRFNGPVPELFDAVMDWIRHNLTSYQVYLPSGDLRSIPELPLNAIREAVANALVHRDLGSHTVTEKSIDIRLEPQKLIIASPGGLKSLTVSQLLSDELTRVQVNQHLYRIATYMTDSDGNNIIEGEGGGIQTMLREMKRYGLAAPTIIDTGVKVTVVFPRPQSVDDIDVDAVLGSPARISPFVDPGPVPAGVLLPEITSQEITSPDTGGPLLASRDTDAWLRGLSRNAPAIVAVLRSHDTALSTGELALLTGLSIAQVRYALKPLQEEGVIQRNGGQGVRTTTYTLCERGVAQGGAD